MRKKNRIDLSSFLLTFLGTLTLKKKSFFYLVCIRLSTMTIVPAKDVHRRLSGG